MTDVGRVKAGTLGLDDLLAIGVSELDGLLLALRQRGGVTRAPFLSALVGLLEDGISIVKVADGEWNHARVAEESSVAVGLYARAVDDVGGLTKGAVAAQQRQLVTVPR